ncbi:MAG TPA: hypothetical protein VIJ33_06410, partial [Solirubrobacteraceae bacterium]
YGPLCIVCSNHLGYTVYRGPSLSSYLASSAARRLSLAILLGCTYVALAGVAWAGDALIVNEAFMPDRLGASTNLSITARFASSADVPPAPVSGLTLYMPAGLGIETQGAGTCTEAALERLGPAGCPEDSRVGFGGGIAVLAFPDELIREPFTLDFFFATPEHSRLKLLISASGVSPVAVALVVVAREIPAPRPYGLGFSVQVPRIATIPGASYASIESAFATIGASNAAYFKTVRGRRTLVHIKGLVVPRSCPAEGFPTRGTVEFADGATFTVNPTIPCPPR